MEIKTGHLYWVDFGRARGVEPGKSRPAIVIQSNYLNDIGHRSTIVMMCTSRLKGESILRTALPIGAAGNELESEILVDQVRAIDNRFFVRELGVVPNLIMQDVRRKLALTLDLKL